MNKEKLKKGRTHRIREREQGDIEKEEIKQEEFFFGRDDKKLLEKKKWKKKTRGGKQELEK